MLYFQENVNIGEVHNEIPAVCLTECRFPVDDQLISVSDCDSEHSDSEQDKDVNTHSETDFGAKGDNAEEWFPFSSKAEYYLYILMHSTTHPVVCRLLALVCYRMY
jgi:hypothetical protein